MSPRQFDHDDGRHRHGNSTNERMPIPAAQIPSIAMAPKQSPLITKQKDFSSTASTTTTSPADRQKDNTNNGPATEVRLFLELALPIILFGAGFVLGPFLTASIVGRKFGTTHLSAFTLANLTGNLCTFSFVAGLYSASDTLSPQAFGIQNYREVGLIAMRGVFASMAILVPMNVVLVLFLKDILILLGQDDEASQLAQDWYRIFVVALPFCILFYTGEKFLSAQHSMKPLIGVVLLSCGIVLPVALQICTRLLGFLGSAVAYVIYQASQAILLFLYLKYWDPTSYVAETWPGIGAWREALSDRAKMMEYLYLGAGGILAQSEWVYWEALSLIVGRLGVVPLTAHAIPNNVIMTMSQIPFAVGIALAIRMGTTISDSVQRAKKIAIVTLLVTTALYGIVLSGVLYVQSDFVISLFTIDTDVIELSKTVWWKVCSYNLNITVFAVLSGIATGLGMQWTFGAINFVFLWIIGVPITIYFALLRGQGLSAAWTWINAPYAAINVCLLLAMFLCTDWNAIRDKIREQHENELRGGDGAVELEEPHPSTAAPLQKNDPVANEKQALLGQRNETTYGISNV